MQNDLLTYPDTDASSFCDSHNVNGTECNYGELDKPISIEVIHVAIKSLKPSRPLEKETFILRMYRPKMAFDSINLHNLWYKLVKQGLNGKMLQLIKDMYNNVKSCVRGFNSLSEYFNCVVGLKRGEVMSLILFSLFIEDLELCLQDDVNCGLSFNDIMFVLMLFADDMVILDNSPADLQQRLELISEYCSKWGLQVNTVKSKNLVFRKRDGLRPYEVLQYNGHGL